MRERLHRMLIEKLYSDRILNNSHRELRGEERTEEAKSAPATRQL